MKILIELYVGEPDSELWFYAERVVDLARTPCVGEFFEVLGWSAIVTSVTWRENDCPWIECEPPSPYLDGEKYMSWVRKWHDALVADGGWAMTHGRKFTEAE